MSPNSPAVLLVDDSSDTLEMYAVGLTFAGYRPFTASTVITALSAIEKERPDAVVTDLQLVGGRGGWDFIEQLKLAPATRRIPIVLLTGLIDQSIAATAQRAGCVAVLTKPCSPDELAHVLDRVLRAVP